MNALKKILLLQENEQFIRKEIDKMFPDSDYICTVADFRETSSEGVHISILKKGDVEKKGAMFFYVYEMQLIHKDYNHHTELEVARAKNYLKSFLFRDEMDVLLDNYQLREQMIANLRSNQNG